MEYKIQSITFKNYRAFYGDYKKIDLNGKNLLVWGENGSGKSSFCKAIQDFVLSINNDNHQKNIFSNNDWSIGFEIDGESSQINFTSGNIADKDYIKNCAIALPFLDYRRILSLYFSPDSKDSTNDELNLFGIFEKLLENFPVTSGGGKRLKDLKTHPEYKGFINNLLNTELKENIVEILRDFKLNFDLEGFVVEDGKVTIKTAVFGEQIEERYHEFLNEARLSALSISVYFAAIKKLLEMQTDILNILVLDDMLIGLDMGNRMAIFDIIKKHFSSTQIFFFTYDKAWFEAFRDKVGKDWICLEMYAQSVNKNGRKFEKPFIKIAKDDWLRAKEELYKNFNYDSCGNLLRKELEKQIDCYLSINRNNLEQKIYLAMLKSRFKLNYDLSKKMEERIDKIRKELTLAANLDGKLKSIEGIIKKFRAKSTIFEESTINEIKKSVLNPASHKDLKPLYRQELEKAFEEIVKLMNENGIEFDLGKEKEESLDVPQNMLNLNNILDKGKIFEFNNAIVQDLKDAGAEKYLNDGYFEFIMKPAKKQRIFSTSAEIVDEFKPIQIDFDDIFPLMGGKLFYDNSDISKHHFIENNGVHSLYIYMDMEKNWGYEIFRMFTDGFVILRKSYFNNPLFPHILHITFPDIVKFVTKSIMFAEQFYAGRLDKNEKIYFEWRLTKTKDRELIIIDNNGRFGGICKTEEFITKRVYEYEELEEYIDKSREVISEIGKKFGLENAYAYVDDFNKDLIGYFNKKLLQVLDCVKRNPKITIQKIADTLGMTSLLVSMYLIKLKSQGKVKKIDSEMGELWEVVE